MNENELRELFDAYVRGDYEWRINHGLVAALGFCLVFWAAVAFVAVELVPRI